MRRVRLEQVRFPFRPVARDVHTNVPDGVRHPYDDERVLVIQCGTSGRWGMRFSKSERAAAVILVISIDQTGRDLICRYLLQAGYTVSAAADETAALRLLRSHAYDLVLLDGTAVGGSARQALKAVREERVGIDPPAVLALVDDSDRMKTLYAGHCPHGLLSKPVRIDTLAAEVEAALANRRAREAAGRSPIAASLNTAGKIDQETSLSELAAAERVLGDAVEAIHDGVVLWDSEDRLVICNDGYRKLFGGHDDLVVPGVLYADLMRLQLDIGAIRVAPKRRDDWLAQRVLAHRSPEGAFDDEYSDGTWIRTKEYRTANGHTVGVCTEISEIKRRETALKMSADSNRRLAAAVDATDTAIMITDPGRPGNPTVFANPAFTTMTGWPIEEALGRDRSFLNGPDTDIDEVARFEEDMRAGRATSTELQLKGRNGKPFWADISASPIRGSDGRIENWVIVQTDVTARKKTIPQTPRSRGKEATDRPAPQQDGALAELLTFVQDSLETALQARQLTEIEARALLDSVFEAARPEPKAMSTEHAVSGPSRPPSTKIDPQSALLSFK